MLTLNLPIFTLTLTLTLAQASRQLQLWQQRALASAARLLALRVDALLPQLRKRWQVGAAPRAWGARGAWCRQASAPGTVRASPENRLEYVPERD